MNSLLMNTLDITPGDHTIREAFAAHNPDLLTDGMLRSIAATPRP